MLLRVEPCGTPTPAARRAAPWPRTRDGPSGNPRTRSRSPFHYRPAQIDPLSGVDHNGDAHSNHVPALEHKGSRNAKNRCRPCVAVPHSRRPVVTGSRALQRRAADAAAEAGRVHQGVERGGVRPLRVRRRKPGAHRNLDCAERRRHHDGGRRAVRKQRRDAASTATRTTTRPMPRAPSTSSSARATSWTQQAYVKASNPGQSDHFGSSVALSRDGNTMAVGAPLGIERRHRHQRQPERQLDPAGRRRLRFHPHRHHLDAAGVHQGLEHRQGRTRATCPATATSSASRSR